MKIAKVKITDIKEEKGLYLIGTQIKAGRFSFRKAFRIEPIRGDVTIKAFKKLLHNAIVKEVSHRKAMEPIKRLSKESFIIEYETKSKNPQS